LKLISYEMDGERAVGVLVGEAIGPLGHEDMTAFLAAGEGPLESAREVERRLSRGEPVDGGARLAEVELLPPVPNPPKCLCVARNYEAHVAETGRELPTHPSLFLRLPRTLVADGAPIVVPPVSDRVDWEGELAVVIGKPGRHVSEEEALGHVAGYSILNDVSIRDYQMHEALVFEWALQRAGAAEPLAALEHQHAAAGLGEVGGGGQPVVAAADDDHVPLAPGELGERLRQPQLPELLGHRVHAPTSSRSPSIYRAATIASKACTSLSSAE
jgi:fumarylacetoacetase-like protein